MIIGCSCNSVYKGSVFTFYPYFEEQHFNNDEVEFFNFCSPNLCILPLLPFYFILCFCFNQRKSCLSQGLEELSYRDQEVPRSAAGKLETQESQQYSSSPKNKENQWGSSSSFLNLRAEFVLANKLKHSHGE